MLRHSTDEWSKQSVATEFFVESTRSALDSETRREAVRRAVLERDGWRLFTDIPAPKGADR